MIKSCYFIGMMLSDSLVIHIMSEDYFIPRTSRALCTISVRQRGMFLKHRLYPWDSNWKKRFCHFAPCYPIHLYLGIN